MWLVNCCNTQCKSCFSRGFPLSPKETIRPSSKMMMKVYLLCPALTNVAVSPLFITALISNEWDISPLWQVMTSPQDNSESPLICHHPASQPTLLDQFRDFCCVSLNYLFPFQGDLLSDAGTRLLSGAPASSSRWPWWGSPEGRRTRAPWEVGSRASATDLWLHWQMTITWITSQCLVR